MKEENKQDKSLKYTLKHIGGEREERIASLKDLYIIISDKLYVEITQLEHRIDKKLTLYRAFGFICHVVFMVAITYIVAKGAK